MASLESITLDATHRARRWDAIVLGSGPAALVAAARLGMRQQRVLIVEEAAAAGRPPSLREPFFLAGARDDGVLESCLRELKVPLIDRRRIAPQPIAYQVIGPELRLDVGEAAWSASELVAWGLAKPEQAEAIVRGLLEAAAREREELLAAPLVRPARRMGRSRGGAQPPASGQRGLPAAVANASAGLGRVLAAQIRALADHASGGPGSEACARLLGGALHGGAAFERGAAGLMDVLRRRVESLYGEFRTLRGRFDLWNAGGLPAVVVEESSEIWVGKALLVAAPASAVAQQLVSEPAAALLRPARTAARRRIAAHWHCDPALLPEGMAPRLIGMGDPALEDPQAGVITLAVHPARGAGAPCELVARTLPLDHESAADAVARAEAFVRELAPFAAPTLERTALAEPAWDDEDWLEPEPAGSPWPGDAQPRVCARPAVYRLDRAATAGLGLEGALALGWRTGDAIADDIA